MKTRVSIEIDDQRSIDVYESYVDVWLHRDGGCKFETIRFEDAFKTLGTRFEIENAKKEEKETPASV